MGKYPQNSPYFRKPCIPIRTLYFHHPSLPSQGIKKTGALSPCSFCDLDILSFSRSDVIKINKKAGSNTEVVLGRVNEAFGSFIGSFKEKQKNCVCFICHRERRALNFANSYWLCKGARHSILPFLTAGSPAIVVVNGLRSIIETQNAQY